MNKLVVVPDPFGGWDVIDPTATRCENFPTFAEAEEVARIELLEAGGGALEVRTLDGAVEESIVDEAGF